MCVCISAFVCVSKHIKIESYLSILTSMVSEFICPKCHKIFGCNRNLSNHLNRQYPCDEGNHQCEKCSQKFNKSSNLSAHRRTCKGRQLSTVDKDKEIDSYKTILAATGRERLDVSSQSSSDHRASCIHNGHGDIIQGDQINNIQNNTNIIVLPIGKENISHIQKLTIAELQQKIGLKSDPSTMIKLFELIRTDESHPENHTMLLPDINGQIMHCKSEDGWRTDTFNNSVQRAIHSDNSFLIRKLPDNFADKSFQDGYIMNEIQQKINFCDHEALKTIYDGIRGPLHDLTMKLAAKYKNDQVESDQTDNEGDGYNENYLSLQLRELQLKEEANMIAQKKVAIEKSILESRLKSSK